MASLLVKESPPELNNWLKAEARLNRRSLSQQILVCLEWCMNTYGAAQFRNPFAPAASHDARSLSGSELAKRLASRVRIDDDTAAQMAHDASSLRRSKERRFDNVSFD